MRTVRGMLAGTVILALLGGMGGAVAAHSEETDASAFPTGAFVSVENNYLLLEFNEDGTGFGQDVVAGNSGSFTYAANGDLYTEMTNDAGVQVPATYYWDFDGEYLAMELWGQDLEPHRNFMYADNTWMLVEDPIVVTVAATDIEAGDPIPYWKLQPGYVPAAEVGPRLYTDPQEFIDSVPLAPISKGQPITPDMLEPMPAD